MESNLTGELKGHLAALQTIAMINMNMTIRLLETMVRQKPEAQTEKKDLYEALTAHLKEVRIKLVEEGEADEQYLVGWDTTVKGFNKIFEKLVE